VPLPTICHTLAMKYTQVGVNIDCGVYYALFTYFQFFYQFLIQKCLTVLQAGSDGRFTSKNRGQMSKFSITVSNWILDLHTGSVEQIPPKLTRGGCRMPQLANVVATGDIFSGQAALEHMSSSSPSTCLFSLCNRSHSLQARWASYLTECCTWVLVFVPPGLEKKGRMRQIGPGDVLIATSHW
jgi:hypothetical protein